MTTASRLDALFAALAHAVAKMPAERTIPLEYLSIDALRLLVRLKEHGRSALTDTEAKALALAILWAPRFERIGISRTAQRPRVELRRFRWLRWAARNNVTIIDPDSPCPRPDRLAPWMHPDEA